MQFSLQFIVSLSFFLFVFAVVFLLLFSSLLLARGFSQVIQKCVHTFVVNSTVKVFRIYYYCCCCLFIYFLFVKVIKHLKLRINRYDGN